MSKEPTKGGAPGKSPGTKAKRKLTRSEKKQIAAAIRQAKGDGKAHTAQQTIPYINLYPDGIPTAITQNVKDLLASREVENIFENSDFVLMLNQAAGDRAILAKQLNISPQQMSYVTHSEAGEGLLFYGNVILPFVDRFPKDTELYRVMTTKPEEVGGA